MRCIRKAVVFVHYAFENKNNDHKTNGEFWLMSALSKRAPTVLFDVGANVGVWSLEANSMFSRSKIYAFEPMPEVFHKLSQNTGSKERIRTFNLALSDSKNTLTFNYYPNARLFSSIYSHFKGGESTTITVEALDGDNFCDENGIEHIDFLKLDVEGSEHLVLKGFGNMLEKNRIRAIQFEYGIFSIESKILLKDYFQLFSKYGYIVGKIYPNYVDFRPYSWELENFIGPNYLAVRKNDTDLLQLIQ